MRYMRPILVAALAGSILVLGGSGAAPASAAAASAIGVGTTLHQYGYPYNPYGSAGSGQYGGTLGGNPCGYDYYYNCAWAQRFLLTIGDDALHPAEFSVSAGTLVAWVNNGRMAHRLVSPGWWDSGLIPPGGRWARFFPVPGEYDYFDPAHPNVRGRLTVTP
jgi:hypothetical protein